MLKFYYEAIDCLNLFIKINPYDSFSYLIKGSSFIMFYFAILYLGDALHMLKFYDKAIECYDIAIKINPNEGKNYFQKGSLYITFTL